MIWKRFFPRLPCNNSYDLFEPLLSKSSRFFISLTLSSSYMAVILLCTCFVVLLPFHVFFLGSLNVWPTLPTFMIVNTPFRRDSLRTRHFVLFYHYQCPFYQPKRLWWRSKVRYSSRFQHTRGSRDQSWTCPSARRFSSWACNENLHYSLLQ
jgi:hypothetical protein